MSTLPLKLRNRINEIDSHTPPRQYIREILHAICDSLGYLFGSAIEIDDHGIEHMVSSFNLPEDYLEQVGSAGTPVLSGPSGEAVKTGKVVVLHNALSDHPIAPWHDILRPYDIKTMVWVPLISGGRTFGTYVLYDTTIRDVSEEELQTLEQIALVISIAMGTNQCLDQPNYKTKELQRENTEHRQAEEALRARERGYRELADMLPQAVFEIDLEGKFTFANRFAFASTGYTQEDLDKGVNAVQLFVPEERERVEQNMAAVLSGEMFDDHEYTCLRKDGSTFPVLIYSARIIRGGESVGLRGIVLDITERKRAEEELRLFSQVVTSSVDGLAIGDLESRVTYVNEAFAEMFGYSREELIGKEIASLYSEEHASFFKNGTPATIAGGWKGELIAKRKDGELFPIAVSSSRVVDDEGHVIAVMASHQDITESKRIDAHKKASLQLLNDLRTTNNIDACLDCGCKAIYEARLFRRAVLTLHNDKREIVNLGQVGLDEGVVQAARNAPAPEAELSKSMTQEEYRISHSYFIPEEAGLGLNESPRHISPTDHAERRDSSWKAGDELFVPIIGDDNKHEGWLSVDTPFDEERPTLEIVRFLEQVVDIVTQKVREVITLEKLRQEHRALLESEERFRLIAKTIPDYIFEADINGITTYCSQAIETILGYTPEERQGIDYLSFIASSDISKAKTLFDKVIEGRVIRDLEINLLHKSGETVATEVSAAPVFKNDKVTNICGVVRDITERKQAEEALRASEDTYRTLIENLPQRIFLKDKDSTYVSCNQNYAHDLRIKPDEIAGKTDYEFYPKELAEKYRADDKRIVESGKIEDIEERYIQNGRDIWVHTVKTPVKDEKGNIVGVLGIFWDITERKRALEALGESEERYSCLVNSSPDGIAATDVQTGQFMFVNPSMCSLTGYSEQELLSTKFDILVPEWFHKEARTLRQSHVAGEETTNSDVPLLTKKGEIRWMQITAARAKMYDRQVVIALHRDVTLIRSQERLVTQQKANLEKLSQRLIEVQEKDRQFLARELHDTVAQELAAAKITIENALTSHSGSDDSGLQRVSTKLSSIIGKLRDISSELRPEVLDSLGMKEALQWYLETTSKRHHTTCKFSSFGDEARLAPHREISMFRVFQELISNIHKHADATLVEVELNYTGDSVSLVVRDNCKGFCLEEKTPNLLRGSGIGLINVSERVALLRGTLEIDTAPGTGTVVFVTIPSRYE